jgi:hypothetical protein
MSTLAHRIGAHRADKNADIQSIAIAMSNKLSFVSDREVLYLKPEFMKLWQAN